ncbi:MAG: 6-carboxytetrahydropterin synthase QueD [Verrucomicrobiae bacterium]|nr:6-carboxytetrahydropterin synthase QueD [Verrucomicrobiae bacterium]
MKIELRKSFTFDAAHYLPNVPRTHRCSQLHGHSYTVEIAVAGALDAAHGWVMDYGELAAAVEPVLEQLDHKVLNEVSGLENPTSENIAVWLWEKLKPRLPALVEIVVAETPTARAIYRGG